MGAAFLLPLLLSLFCHNAHKVIFAVTPSIFIALLSVRGESRKRELRDFHSWTQYNWHIIEIAELKCNMEIMSWIDDTGAVVHDKSNAGQARLTVDFNKVFITPKLFF